jgi:glycosyltransferase involved in cell wall biosynthesis
MRIGIDISQTAYPGTGVARYTKKLVENLLKIDKNNEYILFFSSLRAKFPQDLDLSQYNNLTIRKFPIPATLLSFLWNDLHIFPIECFTGDIDVFLCSDWTQPPAKKAKLITVVHDAIAWKYPQTLAKKIVKTHKKRMKWVRKECEKIICVSNSVKNDLQQVLGIGSEKAVVIHSGVD